MKLEQENNKKEIYVCASTILKSFFIEEKRYIGILIFVIIISTVVTIFAPYLFSKMINDINTENYLNSLTISIFTYAILLGLSIIFNDIQTFMSVIVAEKLNFTCSTEFFKRLIVKKASFFIQYNPAEIQQIQSKGEDALFKVSQLSLLYFIPGLLQIILSLFLMGATVNSLLVLIVIIYGFFYIVISYLANKSIQNNWEQVVTESQLRVKYVGNVISMMETLRYFNANQWMMNKFEASSKHILKNISQYSFKKMKFSLLFALGATVQFLITFFILIPQVQGGVLSIGDLVLFNTLIVMLNKPFEYVGMSILEINVSYTEFKPFAKMWNEPEFLDVKAVGHELAITGESLVFKNVGYQYNNGRSISDISFSAQKGKIVFLFGESGKGKSTLFKLALKSLEVQQGKILIDGIDLKQISNSQWYKNVGVVPQEINLLNDSIENNICLGRKYNKEKIYHAAEKAQILDRILQMEDGFKTQIGEKGLTLSGGERQRIAIARALYSEPAFLFLDEASSSLDAHVEQEIMKEIRKLTPKMIIISITHQRNLIHQDDEVVYL